MVLFAGIDVGTSGARAVLIDERGKLVASGAAGYDLRAPQPGWAEQDPEDWFDGATHALGAALAASGGRARELEGIGLTGQMHSAVLLGERDRVLRPALLWCDQRTELECDEITARAGGLERLIALTRNRAFPGFTAPKIEWVRKHEPEVWGATRSVLVGKDYVRLRLTGERATDVSDASGTLWFDVERRTWSSAMLELLQIDRALLPACHESAAATGVLRTDVARSLGLDAGIKVFAGAGDQAAGAVGAGVVHAGAMSISLGTSGVVFAATLAPVLDPTGALHSFCHAGPGRWHAMGVMLSAGGAIRWLRDLLSPGDPSYAALDRLALESAPGARDLIFLPYLSGERTPILDPKARGVFCGLSLAHQRGELMRAAIEGVCCGLKSNLELMRERGLSAHELRVTGGGARSQLFLQILADVLQQPLAPLAIDEGPGLGAALLAGVGAGAWRDVVHACEATVRVKPAIQPNPRNAAVYGDLHRRFVDLYARVRTAFRTPG
ncbi:MAG: xylulokinase [Planctomycetota bacterium]